MIAAFLGNRQLRNVQEIERWLQALLPQLIRQGIHIFYLGNHGQFDLLAARMLASLKGCCPQIRSVLVLPDLRHPYDADRYDETVFPPLETVPHRLRILRRNEWMLDSADVIIACAWYRGNASRLLEQAVRKGKTIYPAPGSLDGL